MENLDTSASVLLTLVLPLALALRLDFECECVRDLDLVDLLLHCKRDFHFDIRFQFHLKTWYPDHLPALLHSDNRYHPLKKIRKNKFLDGIGKRS